MAKAVYIFKTLYSGCGDYSISIWDDPAKVLELLEERIGKTKTIFERDDNNMIVHKLNPKKHNMPEPVILGKEPTDFPSKKLWQEAIDSDDRWEWEFEHDWSCTTIWKRFLNRED